MKIFTLIRRIQTLGVALCLALAWSPSVASDAETRVGLVINFARYAQWPDNAGPEHAGEWRLCSLAGDKAFSDALRSADGSELYGHLVHVSIITPEQSMPDCHVLFIPESVPRERRAARLENLGNAPILTVSDDPNFVRQGGMIALVVDASRYKFDVDYSRVLRSDLRLASGMLNLARRVR